MTWQQISNLPSWAYQAVWTFVTVGSLYLFGQFFSRRICRQLARWAEKTRWQWDDVVVEALRKGIPFWAVLVGCHISLNYWQFSAHTAEVIARSLHVLTWASITLIAANVMGKIIMLYGSQFQHAMPVTSLTQNLARMTVIIIGGLTILNSLGISIAPMLTALGVGGLAVALGLQDTLSNLFSGFYLTMSRQVNVGDYIRLESGQEGYIHDIGWRSTQIRMLPNNMVIVPNNKLSQAIITNFYLPSRDLAFTVEVGVDYTSDLDKVERVTVEVARQAMKEIEGSVAAFDPVVRFHTLADFSIQLTVVLRAREFVDQYLIKHEFIKRLIKRYRQEGITIPFPTQTVFRKEGE